MRHLRKTGRRRVEGADYLGFWVGGCGKEGEKPRGGRLF